MYGGSSPIIHGSLLDAKRACLDNGMCFGISEHDNGEIKSFAFPVYIKSGEVFSIWQKETLLGIFIYNKRNKKSKIWFV